MLEGGAVISGRDRSRPGARSRQTSPRASTRTRPGARGGGGAGAGEAAEREGNPVSPPASGAAHAATRRRVAARGGQRLHREPVIRHGPEAERVRRPLGGEAHL